MRRVPTIWALGAMVMMSGWPPWAAGQAEIRTEEGPWFTGGFEEAKAAAQARSTLLFLDFRNDSCIPCRRLEAETFPQAEVDAKLRELVSLKLDPIKYPEHQEPYDRYKVRYYPTMIFADAQGHELDRIGEFMTAEVFLKEVQRIQSGDTFAARLKRLDRNPADAELLKTVVGTLHTRLDLAGIYARIDAFQTTDHGLSPDPSVPLLLRALKTEFQLYYQDAERWFQAGWKDVPEVGSLRGAPALAAFLASSPAEMEREEQIRRLRQARKEDAGRLLAMQSLADPDVSTNDLYLAAEFAWENGHYDTAADLFARWFRSAGDAAIPRRLGEAAGALYLSRSGLDTAVEMARAGYAANRGPEMAGTLALVLYATGATEEAIALLSRVRAESEGDVATFCAQVLERMKAGQDPNPERRPPFETFPEG